MGKELIKLNLTSQDILNKQFKPSKSGYDSYEVDEFLDNIINDYRLVEKNMLLKKKQYDDLLKQFHETKEQKDKLEIKNRSYEDKLKDINDTSKVTIDNIDLIKKIDRYERFLWKQGINPNNIK